jgi:multicomponent Na+:H+ antiporter subunit E
VDTQRNLNSARQKGNGYVLQLGLLGFVLVLTWLGLSGFFKPLLLSLGAVSVVITLIFAVRVKFFEHVIGLNSMGWRLPLYWLWLLGEIIKSALQVARIVLSPKIPMNHRMVKITSQSGDELPRVILGNSITLSPGTITIDIDDREVLVHCISEEGAQDMESGELLRRIEALSNKP